MTPQRIVIVGASLAGLNAAEALREAGYDGTLTLVGEEPHAPYDRPPLSKQVLSGWVAANRTRLPRRIALGADWRLGVAAVGLDRERRLVRLADGDETPFDRLVVATGAHARPWPDPGQAALGGVHVLRTCDDAAALVRDLKTARRVLVIGAGFTGCEVASACRARGLATTVVEIGEAPLLPQLGALVADHAKALQIRAGVDLRCGATAAALVGDAGRLAGVRLASGAEIEADVAVVCLGAVRNTDWLAGACLDAGPLGIAIDVHGRALRADGEADPDIFACGDAASAPSALAGGARISVEHWAAAVEQARVVAANIVAPGSQRLDLAPPRFWSMQFGANFKSVGLPPLADEVMLAQGSVESGRFVALYGRAGSLVGILAVNQAQWLPFYERDLLRGGSFPPTYRVVDAPPDAQRQPARFASAAVAGASEPALN